MLNPLPLDNQSSAESGLGTLDWTTFEFGVIWFSILAMTSGSGFIELGKLSMSIYDLVLLHVCPFLHHAAFWQFS